ncbi:MAG: hypothetical protein LUQ26_01945 [Methylococcaceae bacterium]|nr:hypothetical protein [Methylococcaceae bacterium]
MNGNLSRLNFRLLGVFIIVLLTVGCSSIPVGKFDVLAESSQGILNGTSETYTRIEKLQRNYVVERVPNAPLSRDTFHPVTIVNGQIESFDLTPELDFREDALQVLVNYTLVLQAFAKRDFEGDVDKAAADFAGSVKSLAATAAPNNDNAQKASGILATVVDVIGREIIRKERLEALKTVMDSAQTGIEKLAQLIVGDNTLIKGSVDRMIKTILTHKNIQRPPIDTLERSNFDTNVSLIISEADEINNALDNIDAAIKEVPLAHADIRTMLDGKPKNLDALAQLVKDAQRINKLYRSLK